MNEDDLYIAFIESLNECLGLLTIAGYTIKQNHQPVLTGINSEKTVYLSINNYTFLGSAERKQQYNALNDNFDDVLTQNVTACAMLAFVSPEGKNTPGQNARDDSAKLSNLLSNEIGVQVFKNREIGLLDIRGLNPDFVIDEGDQYRRDGIININFAYLNILNLTTPKAAPIEGTITRV